MLGDDFTLQRVQERHENQAMPSDFRLMSDRHWSVAVMSYPRRWHKNENTEKEAWRVGLPRVLGFKGTTPSPLSSLGISRPPEYLLIYTPGSPSSASL